MHHQKIELLAFVINSDEYLLSVASADAARRREKKRESASKRERMREEKTGGHRPGNVYAALR